MIFCDGKDVVYGTVTLDQDFKILDSNEDYDIDEFTLSISLGITMTNFSSIEIRGGLYNYEDVGKLQRRGTYMALKLR